MKEIENILGKQAPKSKVATRIRRFAFNSVLIRYQLMDCWKGIWAQEIAAGNLQEFPNRNDLFIKNEKLQQEFSQIFSPYHQKLCHHCQHCCKVVSVILCRIDCILYGLNPNNVILVPQPNLMELIKRIFPRPLKQLIKHLFLRKADKEKLTHSEVKTVVPCSFRTDTGCKIPWGRRPAFCVIYLCEYFMFDMSWRDFFKYIQLSHQYCHHLSRSARLIVTEYRRQHSR